ncbi:hypothetical protein L914_14376, partial [Phytophthora nicotianae]
PPSSRDHHKTYYYIHHHQSRPARKCRHSYPHQQPEKPETVAFLMKRDTTIAGHCPSLTNQLAFIRTNESASTSQTVDRQLI